MSKIPVIILTSTAVSLPMKVGLITVYGWVEKNDLDGLNDDLGEFLVVQNRDGEGNVMRVSRNSIVYIEELLSADFDRVGDKIKLTP